MEEHEHESIQFDLPKELDGKVRNIFYDRDESVLNIYISEKGEPVTSKVDKSSMQNTLELFNDKIDGTLNKETKLLCIYSIKYHLRKHKIIKFDTTEQKWYSDNYPNDPSLVTEQEKEKKNNDDKSNGNEDEEDEKITLTPELILEIAKLHIKELFIDEYQEPHVAILVNEHLETIPIKTKRFRNWLAKTVYIQCELIPDVNMIRNVINVLDAQAEFDKSSEIIKLNLRVGELNDKWYYDLTNKDWEFIEIDSNGWRIVKNLKIFHRYKNQLPQVYPLTKYPSDIFDKYVNLVLNEKNVEKDKLDEYQILLKCYIICAFISGFPKAISMPNGTPGAAKSTLTDSMKMIIDPCIAKSLSFPRDINELIQQLFHNYVANYDNVSGMSDWISDELCRAVTNSGSSKRRLYTDEDDLIRSMRRCIGVNGVNIAATKSDILDRSIFFKLKRLEDKDRRPLLEIEKELEEIRPFLLGYILDILVNVHRWIEEHNGLGLNISKIPRMADWAGYCEVISRCMGNEENKFLNAYEENSKIQTEEIMETDQIATCLAHFVETDEKFNDKNKAMFVDVQGNEIWGWSGTASELKGELDAIAEKLKINIHSKGWVKNPSWLVKRINTILHTLKNAGIEIIYDKENRSSRIIRIRRCDKSNDKV